MTYQEDWEARRRAADGGLGLTGKGSQPLPLVRSEAENAPKEAFDPFAETVYSVIVTSKSLSSLNIPGVLADCGNEDKVFSRKIVCSADPSHFSYEKSGNSCGSPGCPRHWKTWALQAADRVGMRIGGFRKASGSRYPPRKIILSIDDEDPLVARWKHKGERASVRLARQYFIKEADRIGCKGGAMVIHLWRTNDKVPVHLDGQKKWDFVRLQGAVWRDFVRYSPHAHVIGYGYLKRPEKGLFEYKNMGPLNTRDAVEAVAYYNLSHAAVGEGITAVIYFGCCSYAKLKCLAKGIAHHDDFCPECGAILVFEDSGGVAQRARSWGVFEVVAPPSHESGRRESGESGSFLASL